MILRRLLALLLVLFLSCAVRAESLVPNGDFSKGPEGWLWEQWSNKPLPGKIVPAPEGGSAFVMGGMADPGARYLAKEITLPDAPGFLLKFTLKVDGVPANAARVRFMVPDVGFARGGDLVATGGTSEATPYRFPIGPGDLNGKKKAVLFFYHDHAETGTITISNIELIADAGAAAGAGAGGGGSTAKPNAVILTGDTSKPTLSTFFAGEPVTLTFRASGPAEKLSGQKLLLEFVDELGKKVDSREIAVEPSGNDGWTATVPAPASRLGFYRVYAKLSGGTKLRALGSRAEGFLTYAVVPPASKRKLYPEDETLFGMQGGFGPWVNEVLSYLGARWVLDGAFEWKKNEPTGPGQFNAAAYAAKKEERKASPDDAVDWKTYTLPTLYAAPSWAVVPDTFAYMTGALTPDGEKAWADYCKQAALAYAAKNPDRATHLYQVTWEPIAPWGFKGTKAQLARIYEIAHRALHEADPKAVVGGFTMGIVPEDIEQTSGVLKAGAGPNLDLITTHPYFSIEAERDGMIPAVRSLKEAVRRLAGRDIPMVGTEQGYSTQEDPAKDIVHARGLLRQNLIVLGEGFKFNFAYYVVDYRLGEQRGYGYYYNLVDGVPWGPAKAGPRPAAPALAAQSFLLDGHHAAGAIEWLGNDSWGYAFERPGDVVLALWNYGTQPRTVTIPVGAKQVRVYDWMGNERIEAADKGNLTLQLGPEPLYVRDAAPTLWGAAAGKVLGLASKSLVSYPGEKVTVSGTVANDQDAPLTGKLSLEADPRLAANVAPRDVKAAKGTPVPYAFDFVVPPTLAPGAYPVKVSISNDLGAYAVNGASLQVQPPVALARVQQAEERAGAKGVSLLLRDMQGKGAEGTVEVELAGIEGSKVSKDFKIPPQGEAPVEFRYPSLQLDNAKTYQASVHVALKSGYSFGQDHPVNFVTARRFASAPAFDGSAAAWQSAPVVALGKAQLIRSPQYYSGEADESAALRFKWDAENLYLSAEVTDDTFLQDFTGGDTWKGDSIQLSVNLDPRKDESSTGNLLADVANKQRWSELAFAQTKNGPEAFRHISFDPEQFPLGQVAAKDFRMSVRRDEAKKVTLYEIAIPWKTLGGTEAPKPGSVIGIALCLNDRDEPEQKDPSALGLFGGIYPSKNVKKLGLLLLGEEP